MSKENAKLNVNETKILIVRAKSVESGHFIIFRTFKVNCITNYFIIIR